LQIGYIDKLKKTEKSLYLVPGKMLPEFHGHLAGHVVGENIVRHILKIDNLIFHNAFADFVSRQKTCARFQQKRAQKYCQNDLAGSEHNLDNKFLHLVQMIKIENNLIDREFQQKNQWKNVNNRMA